MWDGRRIYFYRSKAFFLRIGKNWWYLYDDTNEYIKICEPNFESVNKVLDWYLDKIMLDK